MGIIFEFFFVKKMKQSTLENIKNALGAEGSDDEDEKPQQAIPEQSKVDSVKKNDKQEESKVQDNL